MDAVFQPDSVRVDVQMVAAGGAAAEQQLGHGHLGGHLHHLGGQAGPHGVQATQPAEQFGVLHGGHRACQRLVHVVVGIDQPRNDQVPACIDDFVGVPRQRVGRADSLDPVAADEDGRMAQLAGQCVVRVVEGGDTGGITQEQGAGPVLARVRGGAGWRGVGHVGGEVSWRNGTMARGDATHA